MTGDPLYEPLGLRKSPPPRRPRTGAVIGLGFAALAVAAAGVLVRRGPAEADRNTVAVAPIEPLQPATPAPAPPAPAPPRDVQPAPAVVAGGLTVDANGDTVEIQNGVKIIRMGAGRAAQPTTPAPAAPPLVGLSPAPDPALIERTAAGNLPRVGPDGRRPAEVYARPATALPFDRMGAPRLALLVGDMGLDPALTGLAQRKLPPAVSLAFRPDGPDPAEAVRQAREAGHEVLLELPGALPAQADALDGLHRVMGRFAGYIGVTAEVGGGFPTQPGAGSAVLKDLAARGLLLIDNTPAPPGRGGTSAGSLAASPDVVIDGRLAPDTVSTAFARLEEVARSKGQALGYVGHLSDPEPVAAALAGVDGRGIVLVPVSAIAPGPPAAQVQGSR